MHLQAEQDCSTGGSCFVQVDEMLSRLSMLKEHVDTTEALCGLDLDRRRNELVAFSLVTAVSPLLCLLTSMPPWP